MKGTGVKGIGGEGDWGEGDWGEGDWGEGDWGEGDWSRVPVCGCAAHSKTSASRPNVVSSAGVPWVAPLHVVHPRIRLRE